MTDEKTPSVLIVETSESLQRTSANADGPWLRRVRDRSSTDEAIARATERCPDVVLMDIRIKGKRDGVLAAEILRRQFGVPVVYLTAHADEATIQRAKKTSLWLSSQPVKAAELRSCIEPFSSCR